jgi:hypothetical protein
MWRHCIFPTLLLLLGITDYVQAQQAESNRDSSASVTEFFEQKIQPVLVAKCYQCHSRQADEVEGGLRLDLPAATRTGGDSGPAVVPGRLAESLLFQAITAAEMPPDDPLPADVIENFRLWILSGAADSRTDREADPNGDRDYSEARQHWSFQPVRSPSIPSVRHAELPRTAIDRFVLRKLEGNGLRFASPAAPELLLRRLYFDLIGLPPTPDAVDRFVDDPSETAYLQIVDQLLDSPQYGERWAQHWLDVVRYSETEGFEYDRTLPDIWRFRDYVIESFNEDKPYDQFLTEQLAGDEIDPADQRMRIAAGFHRLGAVRRNAGNQKVASSRNEVLTERTDIIGSVVLGLTIGCARCHDHKFDPIPQHDYYRLQAFFAATREDDVSLREKADQDRLSALKEKLGAQIAELKEELIDATGDEEQRIRDELSRLDAQLPPPGPTLCSIKNDFDDTAPIYLLRRGNPDLPGPQVGMRSLGVLLADDRAELPPETANPRTRLASELTDPNHPLTARVIVNRIWQHHFGSGLVSTANDFGKNGSGPSHPELLDHLAAAFMARDWRFKPLHRAIVTSSVYRQSSQSAEAAAAAAIDPDNHLLWSFPRRRLSGEEIRDAMLAISGRLNPQMGGQSVMLPVEQELIDQLYKPTQWVVTDRHDQQHRRSIYLFAKRNLRLPFMEVFDQPTTQTSCAAREQSTHAQQALELLNGPITNELAAALADRLSREAGADPIEIIQHAYRLTTARRPNSQELELSTKFIAEVGLSEFALAMLNINAFLYVE